MATTLTERIKKLEQDEKGYLSAHRTLMAAHKKSRSPRLREVASQALTEADKVRRRINELKKESKA